MTVLFADVSGFTAMCEKLDPEEVHAVMNECFAGLGRIIQEKEGYIDKYIGDNVMALFGAPVAHEDDPARACQAALAMQVFLAQFAEQCHRRTGVPLRMRIGINSGLVLAGRVGSDVRMDYSVMGDTVNLAARLESAAPPGGVLVSREVAIRVRGRFAFGPARLLSVKGKERPVEVYELIREVAEVDPRGRGGLSARIVGRDTELHELVERLQAARYGDRWIEIRGEMGIGKTRLVEEAASRIEGIRLLMIVATSDTSRRPFGLARLVVYGVIREITGQALRPETREALAEALSVLGDDLEPFVDALWHLVAPSWLSVTAPDPDPQTLRRMLERGIVMLLTRMADRVPGLVLFLDSYELADEASAMLFESLATRPQGWPMPILVASRPEGRASLRHEAVIRLGRLADAATGELLDLLVRGAKLPEALRRDVLQRAAGVPLHIEEMVRSLVDDGFLIPAKDGSNWSCDPGVASVRLPVSIRAAMVSRLDRLEQPARELLCQYSVQGVEFDLDVAQLVWHSTDRWRPPMQTLLTELEKSGLVLPIVQNPGKRRAFYNPLMQEACYETLLLRDRHALHDVTASAFCEVAGGPLKVSPELLAHHYERAERWAKAADANLRAGDRAAQLFLNDEAVHRYTRVIEAIHRLEAPSADDVRKVALAHGRASRVHLRVGAYPAAEEDAKKMRAVAVRPVDLAEADRLAALACLHTGRTGRALSLLLGAVQFARDDGSADEVVADTLCDLAELYYRAGRLAEALERLRQCRTVVGAEDNPLLLRADMLEGKIAHTEGRFADATALYQRVYEAAERFGSLSERAR
ncbi:MAG: AAA family ATPase, partial [candidate division NC10 bacterium]|nr:AAA family ATPase [candidate division NC10 bacterium]